MAIKLSWVYFLNSSVWTSYFLSGAVRNNGGGYVNHKLFWEVMGPNQGGEATGEIGAAIQETFGSFDSFKEFWICLKMPRKK